MSDDGFDLLTDTPITIDGERHMLRFANGMSGIGSIQFWIDGSEYPYGAGSLRPRCRLPQARDAASRALRNLG